MNSFVEEMATLLGVQAPDDMPNREDYLKLTIKQEVSKMYLNQRTMQRKLEQSERLSLLKSR